MGQIFDEGMSRGGGKTINAAKAEALAAFSFCMLGMSIV